MPDEYTFFGDKYDWRDLSDRAARDAFFTASFALRDVAIVSEAHGLHRPREATAGDTHVSCDGEPKHEEGDRTPLGFELPAYDRLTGRIETLQRELVAAEPQLYVAEYGPLSDPGPVFSTDGHTKFRRILDWLREVVPTLVTLSRDEWDGWDDEQREHAVWRWKRAAFSATHEPVLRDATLHVPDMWRLARIAGRLTDRPESEQRLIVHGSFVFARLGHLVRRSRDDTSYTNGFAMADRLPEPGLTAEEWAEYADRIAELIVLAGQDLNLNDLRIVEVLDAVERFSRAEVALRRNTSGNNPVVMDEAAFSATYKFLRNATVNAIRAVLPSRRIVWAEPPTPVRDDLTVLATDDIPPVVDPAAAPEVDHEDGPKPPNTFWWKGKQASMEFKPYNVLDHLWRAKDQRALVQDVEKAVWGDVHETDKRLATAYSKANAALMAVVCPMSIRRADKWLVLG